MYRVLLILSLLLYSCGSDQREDVLSMDDIMPTSQRDYDNQGSNIHTQEVEAFNAFDRFGLDYKEKRQLTDKLFPDRFGPDTTFACMLFGSDTVTYRKWVYTDSSRVMNAFYNWIDCFGENCKSIFVGEEKNIQKDAFHLLVSDSTLIYISGPKLNYKTWYSFHDSLGYESDWNYSLEQGKGSRVKWFTFEDGNKIKFEK